MTHTNRLPKNRLTGWVLMGTFSTISLVAIVDNLLDHETGREIQLNDSNFDTRWVAACYSIGLSLAGISIAGHFLKEKFIGTAIEGGLAIVVLAFITLALPWVMDPENNLALTFIHPEVLLANEIITQEESDNGAALYDRIREPNLYYAAWFALFASLLVFMEYLEHFTAFGARLQRKEFNFDLWAVLCASSFIVMASSIRAFKDRNCDDFNNYRCDRTTFAVALGLITGVVSGVWLFAGEFLPKVMDPMMSFAFAVAWTFGIVYITFESDQKRAALELGNLYYFTWASFFTSAALLGEGIKKTIGLIDHVHVEMTEHGNKDDAETHAHDPEPDEPEPEPEPVVEDA